MGPRTLVVVPAFNEAGNVGRLLAEIRALPDRLDVVVVDDGSLDATAGIAAAGGARVLRLPFNCGIGAAVQTGLRLALEEGYEFAARLDGDGQHVSDPTSGLWTANRRAAAVLVAHSAADYPEVDAVLHLARQGCVITEVPVAMRARGTGRSSIDAPRALYYVLKVTIALAVGRLRPVPARRRIE